MLRLNLWISPSISFTAPSCMESSSKRCTNWCAISRTVLPRSVSSYKSNPSIFSFRMYWPVLVLVPCALKWSLLSLYHGIISSGFCFSFDHIWSLLLRTENSWFFCLNYLDKHNWWACALLEIPTRYSPIIYTIFLCVFEDMTSSI